MRFSDLAQSVQANIARVIVGKADVTELLGDHQDAHVAQTIIREVAAHADTDGLTGLSLGVLHEYETEVEMLDRLRFHELWPMVRRRARSAGIA